MKNKVIRTPIGEVIGIGKLKIFCTEEFRYTIPTLSFIVSKAEDGNYISSCLQLMIDGTSASPKAAIDTMRDNCMDFLETLFTKCADNAWEQLEELFLSDIDEFWNAYKKAQILLSRQGIGTDLTSFYEERIKHLQRELDEYRKSDKVVNLEVVDYKETLAA